MSNYIILRSDTLLEGLDVARSERHADGVGLVVRRLLEIGFDDLG